MARKTKPIETTQSCIVKDCVAGLGERSTSPRPMIAILDPPYNQGAVYDAYDDHKTYDEYMNWAKEWLTTAYEDVHKYGSMWIFIPDDWVSEIDMFCRHELGLYKRRHVIWAFTFGQKAQQNFTRSHCHILYLTKTKSKYTFNVDAVKVPSARQLVYKDKRAVAGGKPPDDTWMLLKDQLEPYMTSDKDTWLESRVCGTYKEREKHTPNQIPLPLMKRIILTCSDPGDWVVDPFAGSGTSGVACALHDRNWAGYDISKTCVKQSMRRINEARKSRGLD